MKSIFKVLLSLVYTAQNYDWMKLTSVSDCKGTIKRCLDTALWIY